MRWLPIGDSITKGYPTESGYRGRVAFGWPALVQVGPLVDLHGLHHAGFGGAGIQDLRGQVPGWILKYTPDEVSILLGANNLATWTVDEIVTGLHDLVARIRAIPTAHPKIWIGTLANAQGLETKVANINAALRAQAPAWGATILELGPAAGKAGAGSGTFSDSVHPNQRGYDLMGDVFLRAHGLTPPTSATGAPAIEPIPASVDLASGASIMRAANDVLRRVRPDMPASARQIALAIGWFESRYGVPYAKDSSFAPGGVPSYNWGALVYTPTRAPRFIRHDDHHPDGTLNPGVPFAAYNSWADGARGFLDVWVRPDTYAAAVGGSAQLVAAAMYRRGYYSNVHKGDDARNIAEYAQAIYDTARAVALAIGEPLAVHRDSKILPPPPVAKGGGGSGAGGLVLAGLLIGGAVVVGRSIGR